jgi:hypothetical protein
MILLYIEIAILITNENSKLDHLANEIETKKVDIT